MNTVITINRQFGSGGREVGKRLADVLNIAYFDKEIISKIAEKTNLSPSYIEQYQEVSATHQYPFIFSRTFSKPVLSPNDTIQIEQTKIIKKLAEEQSCVIVGRCANVILKDTAFCVFVYSSDMGKRIQRCYDKVPADKNKATEEIRKMILFIDKQRAKYNQYYTGNDWMNMSNYNLCIDTTKVDIKKAVSIIVMAINR